MTMKNTFVVLFLFAAILTGCEGIYDSKEFKIYEQEEPEGPQLPEIPEIGKKGIGITTKSATWSSRVSATKSHWHYSWGLKKEFKEPDNIDFVPMFWGRGVTQENVDYLKGLASSGEIKYLLGFNEPDGAEQANMTVDEAIERWPLLEQVGVPLVSPAPANWGSAPGLWLEEFMQKANEQNLRVDYIAIHLYYGINPQKYLDILAEVYEKYRRPIWITEMAVADWGVTTPEENRYSPEQVLNFMKEIMPAMEELDYVYRYAWFPFSVDTPVGTSSALWDANGGLTPLGEYYCNFKPNTLIGAGKDNMVDPNSPVIDPNDVVVNGTFETGSLEPWSGFKNSVESNDFMGSYCGKIESGDASLFQVVDLEPGKTYEFKFHAKWASAPPQTFPFAVKEETGGKVRYFTQDIIANETDWTLNTATFTATSEAKVRLLWYKGKVTPPFPAFYLDNVSCVKIN